MVPSFPLRPEKKPDAEKLIRHPKPAEIVLEAVDASKLL